MRDYCILKHVFVPFLITKQTNSHKYYFVDFSAVLKLIKMSAKKGFETKIPEDENTDSGFLSGPISEQLSEDYDAPANSEKVISDSADQQLDSGVDLCAVSECFSDLNISDSTPVASQPPLITVEKSQDIPPLAILFQQDDDGDTQLHIAAVHGCEKSVGTLIRVCPDKALLDVPNDFGHTALHLAVMGKHEVVTRMLVRAGASLAVRDLNGETPLHIATKTRHVDSVHALLGPVPNHTRKLAAILNQKNYNGQTCVHLAASQSNLEMLQMLVYYGADVYAREGLAGWTPLHIAADSGDCRLAQYLLERFPGAAAARDYAGRTPRRLAAKSAAATVFDALAHDTDTDSEYSDDDMYDSDESLFEKLKESLSPINVA